MFRMKCLVLAAAFAGAAQAGAPAVSPDGREETPKAISGPLSSEQIAAIRIVGRNVLTARKSGRDAGAGDAADRAQLDGLRAQIDRLIDADLTSFEPISLAGRDAAEQRRAAQESAARATSAHAEGRALAAQLRNQSAQRAARAARDPKADVRSGGFAFGEQRARQFGRWAEELDAALATEEGPRRTARLMALREQLRSTPRAYDLPARNTPTIQSLPAAPVAIPDQAVMP